METTQLETASETIDQLLVPTDPTLARGMVPYHLNAMLRCMIHATPDENDLPLVALAGLLEQIEALFPM